MQDKCKECVDYHDTGERLMTIVVDGDSTMLSADEIIYGSKKAIDAIALALVLSDTNTSIDMIKDCPEDFSTKELIERKLNAEKTMAYETLEDALDIVRARVREKLDLTEYRHRVLAMRYDLNGELTDIDVKIAQNKVTIDPV